MALITDNIKNILGGVSEQPSNKMLSNMALEIINCALPPYKGLMKRPCTNTVKKLMARTVIHPYIHTINKENETYSVFLTGDGIKVYDTKTGIEKTVTLGRDITDTNPLDYITTDNPLEDLYCVTLGDYTFVLNKTKKVALSDITHTQILTQIPH